MSNLNVTTQNNTLVVDSRLIAEDLGIEHRALVQTIKKHQSVIEQHFGVVTFPVSKPSEGSQGGRPQKYALLTVSQLRCLLSKTRYGLSLNFIENLKENGIDLGDFLVTRITRGLRKESDYSDLLAKQLDGKREVKTLAGNIDILTNSEVIEVKNIKAWKHALGQVIVYGNYYPSHKKRIHLYGETQESFLDMIRSHCKKLNILVTWEP
jgi:hypothetical protein